MVSRSCLLEALASMWVDFYHGAFVSKQRLREENEMIQMSLIQSDLASCYDKLCQREAELIKKIEALGADAVARKRRKDLNGAKRKMLDRKQAESQLQKLQNSMTIIDIHRNTIEGSALDRSVLEALRASGDALKHLGASGQGIGKVEDIIHEVETQMEEANEITKIISSGSISGNINASNMMMMGGIDIDEDSLMKELDDMMLEEDNDGEIVREEDLKHRILPSPPKSKIVAVTTKPPVGLSNQMDQNKRRREDEEEDFDNDSMTADTHGVVVE